MELNDTQKMVLLTKLAFCVDGVTASCHETYKDTKMAIRASYNWIQMAYEKSYEQVNATLHEKEAKIALNGSSSRCWPKIFKHKDSNKEMDQETFAILAKNIREIAQLLEADESILTSLQLTRLSLSKNLSTYKLEVEELIDDVTKKFLQETYALTQTKGKTPTELKGLLDEKIERISFDSENSYLKPQKLHADSISR